MSGFRFINTNSSLTQKVGVGMSSIVGPTGPQGWQGSIGYQGSQGISGFSTNTGAQGWQGPVGYQGEIGVTGVTGLQGPQGPQGWQGLIGPTGTVNFESGAFQYLYVNNLETQIFTGTYIFVNTIESNSNTLNIATNNDITSTLNIGTSNSVQTINLGTVGSGQTTINIGGAGDQVRIAGDLVYLNSSVDVITNPYIILNNGSTTINNSGLVIAQTGSSSTGVGGSTGAYFLVNSISDGWVAKAGDGATVNLNQDIGTGASPVFSNIYAKNNVYVDGNVYCTGGNGYFKEVFVSTGSLYIGDVKLHAPDNQTIQIDGIMSVGTGNFESLSAGQIILNSGSTITSQYDTLFVDGHMNVSNLFTFNAITSDFGVSQYTGGEMLRSITMNGLSGNIYATGGSGSILYSNKAYVSDRIGIGSTNPATKLQVNGALSLTNTTLLPDQTNYNLYMAGGHGSPVLGKIYVGDGSGWRLNFSSRTGGVDTDLYAFTDVGNFGVGTNSPSGAVHIHSKSSTLPTLMMSGRTLSNQFTQGGIAMSYFFGGTGNKQMVWYDSDMTDVNATNPYLRFGMYGSPYIDSISSDGSTPTKLKIGGKEVLFFTNGVSNDRLMISQAGNIGIGTTGPNAPLQFANTAVNRKIVLYEDQNNDHQYSGFGINSFILRYQVGSTSHNHIFYAGTSSTASQELMRIKGDGNVGIGTQNVNYKLEISGDFALQNQNSIRAKNSTGTYEVFCHPRWSDDATYINYGQGGMYFRNYNGSTTNMFISNGGRVGIGNTSPSTNLDVTGSIRSTDGILVNNQAYFGSYKGNGSPFAILSVDSGNALRFGGAGGEMYIGQDSSTSGLSFGYNSTGPIRFFYGTNTSLFISGLGASTGCVGIGTSTPNAPLQFANTAVNRKVVLFDDNNNDHGFYGFGVNGYTLRYQVNATSASHVFFAGTSTTTSQELMRIKGDGNVGIGTSTVNERFTVVSSTNTLTSGYSCARIRCDMGTNDIVNYQHRGQLEISRYSDQKSLGICILDNGTACLQAKESGVGYNNISLNPVNGKVGISTTTPTSSLTITQNSYDRAGGLNLNGSGNAYRHWMYTTSNDLIIDANGDQEYRVSTGQNDGSGNIKFYTAGGLTSSTERMRIRYDGYVGIGAVNPLSLLSLYVNYSTSTYKSDQNQKITFTTDIQTA